MNEVSGLGAKVGGRAAKLVADGTVYAQQKLTDHKSGLAQKILADFTNHVSDEVQQMFGPVWKLIAEHEETPDLLRPLFKELAGGRGQGVAWLGGSIAGTATSAGLFDLLNNYLAPVIHRFIYAEPNGLLSPDIAAQALVRGFDIPGEQHGLLFDVMGNGINVARLDILRKLAQTRATTNQSQDLVNRKIWSEPRAIQNLIELGHGPHDAESLIHARHWLTSPQEAAAMEERDIINRNQAIDLGMQSGATEVDIDRLIQLAGEPLGAQALAEAYRRRFIDRARFERGIVQGPLRKEWFDVLEQLSISRMSTIDAADAVNQGHMLLEQAKDIALANGLDANDFQTLIEIAGAPPGVDFITEALNRGFIDETTFNAAFLESRIKNKYVHLYSEMRFRLIPQETVRLAYRHRVYPHDKALDTLLKHGFTQEDATALLALEDVRQDGGAKELTRVQIIDLYEVRAVGRDAALGMLVHLGFSDANANTLLDLADLKRIQRFVDAAITRVRAAFLAGRIDEATASASLDQFGVPNEQRDELLALWDIDRTTITKTLTPAQVRQAVKKNLMAEPEALARLRADGYDARDAELFLKLTT
jgi:hypothetical protein